MYLRALAAPSRIAALRQSGFLRSFVSPTTGVASKLKYWSPSGSPLVLFECALNYICRHAHAQAASSWSVQFLLCTANVSIRSPSRTKLSIVVEYSRLLGRTGIDSREGKQSEEGSDQFPARCNSQQQRSNTCTRITQSAERRERVKWGDER